jgi:hypothetical protein
MRSGGCYAVQLARSKGHDEHPFWLGVGFLIERRSKLAFEKSQVLRVCQRFRRKPQAAQAGSDDGNMDKGRTCRTATKINTVMISTAEKQERRRNQPPRITIQAVNLIFATLAVSPSTSVSVTHQATTTD